MKRRKRKEKKSNFVEDEKSELSIYKKGALIGALIGGVAGIVIGKKIILSIIIGAIGGGYIAYQLNSDDSSTKVKKFSQPTI